MAGKYGSPSVTVQVDDAPGGTLRTITNHILSIGGVKVTSPQELSHAFGDSWEESTPTGVSKIEDLVLEGHWDTTATTGPHAVLRDPDDSPQDATRTMVVGFGDSVTATFEMRLMDYEILPRVGALTRFRATVRPTGAITWAP